MKRGSYWCHFESDLNSLEIEDCVSTFSWIFWTESMNQQLKITQLFESCNGKGISAPQIPSQMRDAIVIVIVFVDSVF